MAVSSGINPQFDGVPTAAAYHTKTKATSTKGVPSNGTTEVDVFASTTGFNGSVTSIRITPMDTTAGEYSVYAGTPNGSPFSRYLILKAKKDGGVTGGVTGSYVSASGAFTASGSLTVVSSSSGNAFVEVEFTPYVTP